MNKFIIVQVDYQYCNYLRNFDERVPYNSGLKRNRPFIGVLFQVADVKYFTPLSSPKEKHKYMHNTIDFFKIDKGNLGAINFNNMIPVKEENYKEINLSLKTKNSKEIKYYNMLKLQLMWLNKNYQLLTKRAYNLYNLYNSNKLEQNIKNRCCNFLLLEQKCQEYTAIPVSNL